MINIAINIGNKIIDLLIIKWLIKKILIILLINYRTTLTKYKNDSVNILINIT